MRLQPILSALDAGKSVIQLVEIGGTYHPSAESIALPAVYLYRISESANYSDEICADQQSIFQFELRIIAENSDSEPIVDAREEARQILCKTRVAEYDFNNILFQSGSEVDIERGVVIWSDIYQVQYPWQCTSN